MLRNFLGEIWFEYHFPTKRLLAQNRLSHTTKLNQLAETFRISLNVLMSANGKLVVWIPEMPLVKRIVAKGYPIGIPNHQFDMCSSKTSGNLLVYRHSPITFGYTSANTQNWNPDIWRSFLFASIPVQGV